MDENTGKFLSSQLYPDLKNWIPALIRRLKTPVDKLRAPVYYSPADLSSALKANQVKPDSWVTLECKPSMFGPYLRNHFITHVIGHSSDMRLGPQVIGGHPLMAMMGNVTSHLKPVGIYPPIDDDLYQICLYPSDASVCGMVGLMPGVNNLVEYIPAVSNAKNLAHLGASSNVRGVVRQVDPKLLSEVGVPIEKYEELRQSGDIWFLDLSEQESEIEPLGTAVVLEMWGGLYASGHMEIREGQLKVDPLVSGMADVIRSAGFEPFVTQNKAGKKEITIYSKGIRAVIDINYPVYSIHMDAEVALQYKENKKRFDSVCEGCLKVIKEVSDDCDVDLANPNDLDFSYTNSTDAYSVLKSVGSEYIADPLGIAIRDWHRKRGA